MNITLPWIWLSTIISRERKEEKLRLLNQQQNLLYHGFEASAEVLDSTILKKRIGNLQLIKIWIKLRKDEGHHIYTHSQALVNSNILLQKGQLVRVKYFPDDLSSILIL